MRQVAIAMLWMMLAGCALHLREKPETGRLVVFAAASLTDAFTEIGSDFEAANPGVDVVFSFAGSQTLRTQILAGARPDIFASANLEEMDALVSAGLVAIEAPHQFIWNNLVVIVPPSNPAGIAGLADLGMPGIKLVLAAEDVPVGLYARGALESLNATLGADYAERVLANTVSKEDNVRQVLAKIQLGEADAGIVYRSDSVAAPGLGVLEIPREAQMEATYPIAVLSDSQHPAMAQRFLAYVFSPDGRRLLRSWGFTSVP
jgi:molybdate transport system substrate-binding protein